MLRFTKEQEEYVLNHRRMHEAVHNDMSQRFGINASNAEKMQMNASPLPRDVWGIWDTDAIAIQRNVLAVFNDLAASVSTPMPLGKLLHYFQQVGDNSEAHISMDGRSKARNDQPEYNYVGTPLPIIDSTFGFGWRQMLSAQTEGIQLDAAARLNSVRKVAEKLESIALYGDSRINVGGSTLYGILNHPKRNTRATGVTLATATGAQFKAELVATLKLLHSDNFRGRRVTIYLNWDDYFAASQADYVTTYKGDSILDNLRRVEGVANIVPASDVPANTIAAVIKERDVIQVLNGMPLTTRAQARFNPEDDYNFVVMAAAAVEIKYDANDNIGVAVSS